MTRELPLVGHPVNRSPDRCPSCGSRAYILLQNANCGHLYCPACADYHWAGECAENQAA